MANWQQGIWAASFDIALWGAEAHLDGPVEVQGTGTFPTEGACISAEDADMIVVYSEGIRGFELE